MLKGYRRVTVHMAFLLLRCRERWRARGLFCLERCAPARKEFPKSTSPRLEVHRTILRQQVLPAYERLGSLRLVYLLGSVASGYTDQADLDLMMVWESSDVPAGSLREPLVAYLDERKGVSPFVVDYRDIHLERYVISGQEYNVAHQTLTSFEAMLQSILDGRRNGAERVLDPLVAATGFYYGELVLDRQSLGQRWKSRFSTFPPVVKQECLRAVLAHRQEYFTDLTTLMRRVDWFKFHCILVEAVRTTMRALFALHEVYYPGDKWLRKSILRFGLDAEVLARTLLVGASEQDCDLCELHPGEADVLSWEDYRATFEVFDLLTSPTRAFAPGAESWLEFIEWVRATLERLTTRFAGQTVVAVTHAGFIMASVLVLFDIPQPGTGTRMDPCYTSLTEVHVTQATWQLLGFNDTAHVTDRSVYD